MIAKGNPKISVGYLFFVGRLGIIVSSAPTERHSRNASEREARLFSGNIGSPIKAFGDDVPFKKWKGDSKGNWGRKLTSWVPV
jgi:hypothetical protein